MPSTWLFNFRLVTFATSILLSVIVMGLSADLVSIFSPLYWIFSGLGLAVSLLTIFTITPMLIIDKFRQGSIFSYACVEIAWLTILWILWLASGSYAAWTESTLGLFLGGTSCDFTASVYNPYPPGYDPSSGGYNPYSGGYDPYPGGYNPSSGYDVGPIKRACHETKAVIAFSFILWILLMTYTVTLLVLTLRAHGRGHPAWTMSVRDGGLLRPTEQTTGNVIQMPVAQKQVISTPYVPATQTQIISTPYVPATQMTTIPQSYIQTPATHAPSYPSPAQRSLSMSVSPSIPQV